MQPSVDEFIPTRHGDLRAFPQGDLISDFLRHFGEWAWLEVEFLSKQLPPNPRVLDAGAYVGSFGLGLLKTNAPNFICFIEPARAAFDALEANVARASAPAACLNVVLGKKGGRYSPSTIATNLGHTTWRIDPTISRADSPSNARTLSEIVDEYGPFDILKMDIEGSELSVLRDGGPPLLDGQILWIEANRTIDSLKLVSYLLREDYSIVYVAWPAQNPHALRNPDQPLLPLTYEAGLFVTRGATELRGLKQKPLESLIVRTIRSVSDLSKAQHLTPHGAEHSLLRLSHPELVGLASSTELLEIHASEAGLCALCQERKLMSEQALLDANEALKDTNEALRRYAASHRVHLVATGLKMETYRRALTEAADEVNTLQMRLAKLYTSTSYRVGKTLIGIAAGVPFARRLYRWAKGFYNR